MTVYDVVLFAHITSVIIMFAGVTADWLAVAGLRATPDAGPARAWIRTLQISAAFGPWARLAVLGAGLYLAVDAWSWPGWIIVGLISWVAFVLLGEPLTGRELRDMAAAVAAERGTLPPALIARLHLPRMWQAVLTRAGLGIGVVFIMAVKPPAAVAGTAVVLGALAGYSSARLSSRPGRAGTQSESGRPGPFPGLRRDIMHPMFKKLFIGTDADDLAAEQDRRRRARRPRRARPAMIVRPAARHRENRLRP